MEKNIVGFKFNKESDGKTYVVFTTTGPDGEIIESAPELYKDENGVVNKDAENKIIKIGKLVLIEEKKSKFNEQISKIKESLFKTSKKKESNKKLPDDVKIDDVNERWIEKHINKLSWAAVTLGVVAIIYSLSKDVKVEAGNKTLTKEPTKKTEEEVKTTEASTPTIKKILDNGAIEKVTKVSLEDYANIVKDVDDKLNKELELNVPAKSIQATVFAANAEYISDEDTKALVDNNVIPQDGEDLWKATLETTRTLTSVNSRSVNEDTIISGSIFCANPEAKKVCDAFTEMSLENGKAYRTMRDLAGKKKLTDEEKEAKENAIKVITDNWHTFMLYDGIEVVENKNSGILIDGKYYNVNNTPKEAHWLAVIGGGNFAVAALSYAETCDYQEGKTAKQVQAEIDYASHVGKDSSQVNTNYAAMKQQVLDSLGRSCEDISVHVITDDEGKQWVVMPNGEQYQLSVDKSKTR